jgi:hypothetical protein
MDLDLKKLIVDFLDEQMALSHIDVARVTRLHAELIGSDDMGVMGIGFLKFLKASGNDAPTLEHVSSHWIGRYWEYLTQHHGTLRSASAMKSLKTFWRWSQAQGRLQGQSLPPDLKVVTPVYLYRLSFTIQETKLNGKKGDEHV